MALDVDDVRLSARKGLLIVRSGKGERYCELPAHAELRENLAIWLDERPDWPAAGTNSALFLNHRGGRLTTRGARDILIALASEANLEVESPATFCATPSAPPSSVLVTTWSWSPSSWATADWRRFGPTPVLAVPTGNAPSTVCPPTAEPHRNSYWGFP